MSSRATGTTELWVSHNGRPLAGARQLAARRFPNGRIAEGSRSRLSAAAPPGATGSVNGLVDVLQGALLLRRDNAAAGATSEPVCRG